MNGGCIVCDPPLFILGSGVEERRGSAVVTIVG